MTKKVRLIIFIGVVVLMAVGVCLVGMASEGEPSENIEVKIEIDGTSSGILGLRINYGDDESWEFVEGSDTLRGRNGTYETYRAGNGKGRVERGGSELVFTLGEMFGIAGKSVSNISEDYLFCRNGRGAMYDTIKVYEIPESGLYDITARAGKGQDSHIEDCITQHWRTIDGVSHEIYGYGSYGSYLKASYRFEKGDKLLIVSGSVVNGDKVAYQKGSSYDQLDGSGSVIVEGDDSSDSNGYAGASVFIFKYIDSQNLFTKFNEVSEHNGGRSYNGEVLVLSQKEGVVTTLELPNCELLMVCGGGNGGNSYCAKAVGNDYIHPGTKSGYWLYGDVSTSRPIVAYTGAYTDLHLNWLDSTTIKDGYWIVSDDNYKWSGNVLGEGTEFGIWQEGDVWNYDFGVGEGFEKFSRDNEAYVNIETSGNYIHYKPNYPSGVEGSGFMYAERVGLGEDAWLSETCGFSAGDDYDFIGWSYTTDGEVIVPRDIGEIKQDITVYAKWKKKTWVIDYQPNPPEGKIYGGIVPSVEVEIGSDSVVSGYGYTVSGYRCIGWGKAADGAVDYRSGGIIQNITGNMTLYAIWEKSTYTIEYVPNNPEGTTCVGIIPKKVVECGQGSTASDYIYIVGGYKCIGWSESVDGAVKYTKGDEIPARDTDLVLYAKWERKTWSVVYHANPPEGYSGIGEMPIDVMDYSEGYVVKSSAYNVVGFVWCGWSEYVDGSVMYTEGSYIAPREGVMDLYGVWMRNSYSVNVYNNYPNGSTGDLLFIK